MLNCAVSTGTKPTRLVNVKYVLAECRFMHKRVFAPRPCFTIILVPLDKIQVNEQRAEENVTLNQKKKPEFHPQGDPV